MEYLKLVPAARVGHVGMYRDPETLKPVEYYCKLPAGCSRARTYRGRPDAGNRRKRMRNDFTCSKKKDAQILKLMCLIAAPEGIETVRRSAMMMWIFLLRQSTRNLMTTDISYRGWETPGDRLFGTK